MPIDTHQISSITLADTFTQLKDKTNAVISIVNGLPAAQRPQILTLVSSEKSVSVGDTIGKIEFVSSDTSDGSSGVMANIEARALSGDKTDLYFRTGYSTGGVGDPTLTDAMVIKAGSPGAVGYVGIGTTDPKEMLHVEGPDALIRLSDDTEPNSYTFFQDNTATQFKLNKYTAAADQGGVGTIIDINPQPADGEAAAQVRLFRSTGTTGVKSLALYKGDNSDTVDAEIGVDGRDTYFAVGGGKVGIGDSTPTWALDIDAQNAGGTNDALRIRAVEPTVEITAKGGTNSARLKIFGTADSLIEFSDNGGVETSPGAGDAVPFTLGLDETNRTFRITNQSGGGLTSNHLLSITEAGNVGIGESIPLDQLHLYDDVSARIRLESGSGGAETAAIYNDGSLHIRANIAGDNGGAIYYDADNHIFSKDNPATALMHIDNAGNLGANVLSTGSTTHRTLADRWGEVFNVKDYGAKGDGTTDDTAEIQAAIDQAYDTGGGVVTIPVGTFIITSTLVLKENVYLQGSGDSSIIDYTTIPKTYSEGYANFNTVAIEAIGTVGTKVSLTVDATEKESTVTVADASSFSEGQWVQVGDDSEYPYSGSFVVNRGEIKKIRSIAGGVISLTTQIYEDYATADSAFIRPVSFVNGVGISDIRFLGSDADQQTMNNREVAVWLEYCKDFYVNRNTLWGQDLFGIYIRSSIVGEANDNKITGAFRGPAATSKGTAYYGITLSNNTQWVTISGNKGETLRRMVVNTSSSTQYGQPYHCVVSGNVFRDSHSNSSGRVHMMEHHGFGRWIVYSHNISDSAYGGMAIEGRDLVICDNQFVNSTGQGINFDDEGKIFENIHIHGNTITREYDDTHASYGAGIVIDSPPGHTGAGSEPARFRNVIIENNNISGWEGDAREGIRLINGVATVENCSIRNNTIDSLRSGSLDSASRGILCDQPGWEIYGNRIHNYYQPIRLSVNANGCKIHDNKIINDQLYNQASESGIRIYSNDNQIYGNYIENFNQGILFSSIDLTGNKEKSNEFENVTTLIPTVPTDLESGILGGSIVSTGSTTSRSLADRWGEVFNVLDYGTKGDGSTDDTVAIQAAIDACEAAGDGGMVYLPAGDYRISATLNIRKSIAFHGAGFGSDNAARMPPREQLTEIVRIGATGGTDCLYITSSTAGNHLTGVSIKGIAFDVGLVNTTPYVIHLAGVSYSWFDEISITGLASGETGILLEPALAVGGDGCAFNEFGRVRISSSAGATCIQLRGETLTGSQGTACFQNHFQSLDLTHGAGVGILGYGNTDNNIFDKFFGTGDGISIKTEDGETGIQSRGWTFGYAVGEISLSAGCKGFDFGYLTSEGGGLTHAGTNNLVAYRVQDSSFNNRTFQTKTFLMNDEAHVGATEMFSFSGSPALGIKTGGTIPAWAFDDSTTEEVTAYFPVQPDWEDGKIVGVELRLIVPSSQTTRGVRFRIKTFSNQPTGGTGTGAIDSTDIATYTTEGTISTEWNLYSFTIPVSGSNRDANMHKDGSATVIVGRLGSDGADTCVGDIHLVSVGIQYDATGPGTGSGWVSPSYRGL